MDFCFLGAESSIENCFKSSRSRKSIFHVVPHLIKAKLFSVSMSTIWAWCGYWIPWFSTITWSPICRPSSDNTLLCSFVPSSLLPNWVWLFDRKPSLQGSYFHHVLNLLLQLCHKFDQEWQDKMNHLCQWQLHISHFYWNSQMSWFDFQRNLSLIASQALIV